MAETPCRRSGHTEGRTNNGTCRVCKREDTKVYKHTTIGAAKQAAAQRARNLALKVRIVNHYGDGTCACCGESEIVFLTLDHVNDDGAEHRRELTAQGRQVGGAGFYRDLERDGYPEGFQVLCMNCQLGKRQVDGCPHKVLVGA